MADYVKPHAWFRPVSRIEMFAIGASVAVVLLVRSRFLINGWRPPLWSDITALPRESLIVLGPLLALVAALHGSRRHTMSVGAVPARGWPRIAAVELLLLSASVLGGVVLGVTPAIVSGARRATGGHFAVWSGVGTLVGYVVITAFGFLIGVAWASRVAPLVAALLSYVVLVGPVLVNDMIAVDAQSGATPRSLLSISLIWTDFRAGVGRQEVASSAIQRLLLFSVLLIALVMAAARIGDRSTPRRVATALSPLMVPILLGAVLVSRQPVLVEPITSYACSPVAESQVCVPADVSVLLPPIEEGAESIVVKYGFGAVTRTDVLSERVTYWYGGRDLDDTRAAAVISTASAVAGIADCIEKVVVDDAQGAGPPGFEFARALAYTMSKRTNLAAERLDASLFAEASDLRVLEGLSDGQLRGLIESNAESLQACTYTVDEVAR